MALDKDTERYAVQAQTEGVPYVPGDLFPTGTGLPKGYSDLNVHMLDMLDEGKPDQDPFREPGSIPGETAPGSTT